MKLTESHLRKLIMEEFEEMIDEGFLDRLKAKAKGSVAGLKGRGKAAAVGALGKVTGWADEETGKKMTRRADTLRKGAEGAQKGAKLASILDSHVGGLTNDLKKLGIPVRGEIKRALTILQNAITKAAAKAGK